MENNVEEFVKWIKNSDNIVFFGGAGVSTESGIPDFRSVKEALSRGFDEIIIFGGTGGRMDHTYANISVLSYIRSHNARGMLIDESNSLMIISDEEMLIENKCGERFSIFAFGCESCVVTLSGFEYELEKGRLFAEIPLGISNVITADTARVKIDEGSAVIIFSKE